MEQKAAQELEAFKTLTPVLTSQLVAQLPKAELQPARLAGRWVYIVHPEGKPFYKETD